MFVPERLNKHGLIQLRINIYFAGNVTLTSISRRINAMN